jgi:hypothetical protein
MLLKKKSRSKCRAINFRVKPLQQFASELSARLDGNGSPGGGSCNITDYDFLVARFEQLFAQAVGNPRLAAEARALSSLAEDIANALHTAINQHQSNGSIYKLK